MVGVNVTVTEQVLPTAMFVQLLLAVYPVEGDTVLNVRVSNDVPLFVNVNVVWFAVFSWTAP